ncbi:endoglucanase-4 [Colletotrichum spaethianum]|uniref:lytic cellulose monooxygenase (C4-dehydrogenating) n=1 Tax=Colletotrichum spaethianum TaxID=700344 RepID=A0AA37L613_9PEZI|nr:endoglucanase-4 [Colletotrichum spaethianum]GKT41274.1 endoglucanase-4 [Colletotrichum spaethianum]
MGCRKIYGLMVALASAAKVAAHGHVTNIVINGVSYRNYIPVQDPYTNNPPLVAGWTIDQRDNGFVAPDAYNAPDIICHRQAVAGKGRITVAAGDTIQLQWTEWPDSHKGPVINWLANCNGPCNLADKTDLLFFKIDGAGLIDPPQRTNRWAASVLIENGNAWLVRIPPNIAPGHYVLRHDIIALHSAGQQNGAQSYPQCINLEITGEGTYNPLALLALLSTRPTIPVFCTTSTAIISMTTWFREMPSSLGSRIQITASGSATPYGTTRVVSSTSILAASSSNTSSAPTTLQTLTTTALPSDEPTQVLYGQCGGSNYLGPTKCPAYAACSTVNPYYAQCTPASVPVGLQSLYGQCGGRDWPEQSATACVPGARCSTVNPWYAQCTPA